MAKSTKLNNKDQEKEFLEAERLSVNLEEWDMEYSDLVSVNRAFELDRVEPKKLGEFRGKTMPRIRNLRDPKKDVEPITPEQVGLEEEDQFLVEREVRPDDLRRHQAVHQKDFLGTNFRKPRDFFKMFERGKSTEEQPRLDLSYGIEYNTDLRKTLIAEQILCNLQSRDTREVGKMKLLLKDLEITNEEIKEFLESAQPNQDEELVQQLQAKIPNAFT